MGRAKLKMELIEKPKSRILTFKKRKEGLMKKLHQLTTLCDIGACMIIYEPTLHQSSIWPERNPDQVRRLIEFYKSKSNDLSSIKTYGLPDFFVERKRKVEEELLKLRKSNSEAKYPTWNDCFNLMNESQLRGLGAALHTKAQIVRSRIEMMRMREKQDLEMMKNMMLFNSASASAPPNFSQFYNLEQEFKPAIDMGGYMNMVVPQNYYAAAPPLPPQAYPYMVWPVSSPPNTNMNMAYTSMDQNLNYYSSMDQNQLNYLGDDGDDITQYLLQFNT